MRSSCSPVLLAFQSISPGYYLEFTADGFLDLNHRVHLENERRKHRTEFMNGHQIVTFHQHVPTPFADSDHEEIDLEIGGRSNQLITYFIRDSPVEVKSAEQRLFGRANWCLGCAAPPTQ